MTLTARRAHRLRKRVVLIGFCPERPGLLHDWRRIDVPDWTSCGAVSVEECSKCGEWHS